MLAEIIGAGEYMAKVIFSLAIASLFLLSATSQSQASTNLRICTQNLQRVGKPPFGRNKDSVAKQTQYLVERIIQAKCDIIAVQEVYGKSKTQAADELNRLTKALSDSSGTAFFSLVGESQFDEIRNGFIIKEYTSKVLYSGSPPDGVLPKLNPLQRSRTATRRPFALLLDVANTNKHLLLVGIHLKSKVGGFKDSSGLDFETLRMESSEQTREFAQQILSENKKHSEIVAIILGDRNSRDGSATDLILQGALTLNDFREACGVNQDLEPTCRPSRPPLFSPSIDPRTNQGSSKYKGEEELIDEIYVTSSYIEKLRNLKKNLNYGLVGDFFRGSDHKLVWIDLPL